MKETIGDLFQKETKYIRGKLSGRPLLWHKKPKAYKKYPKAPKISLEIPSAEGGAPIWTTIAKRRSVRNFKDASLTKQDLSRLLWATQGITKRDMGFAFRACPSAGALYPVETYLVLNNVERIDAGIYHYNIQDHSLEQLKKGDFRSQIAQAALDQDMAYAANAVFVWTAVFGRAKWKYEQRAYRYVYLDAGHIAQNLALAAIALILGTCQIAALYDEEVNSLLAIDGKEESVLYMSVVGHPR
ncbi:MAG: SagB/ThcOx family dehydrogenase [Candidatus Aminicenantes bacterium]|nr:MAG: SagB/ThcOx family dehydrogenase [Candidatus Aminicenantes bacterium]